MSEPAKKLTPFFGGVPTVVDVDLLQERFGVPKPGGVITHEEIEEALGLARRTRRYATVLGAWRDRLDREHNVLLRSIRGQGYEAMDGHARVTHSGGLFKAGLRRLGRAENVAARTDRSGLTTEEVQVLGHVQATAGALRAQAATAARKLAYPVPGLPGA